MNGQDVLVCCPYPAKPLAAAAPSLTRGKAALSALASCRRYEAAARGSEERYLDPASILCHVEDSRDLLSRPIMRELWGRIIGLHGDSKWVYWVNCAPNEVNVANVWRVSHPVHFEGMCGRQSQHVS